MPKQYQITLDAGAGFTDVPATIPAHYMKFWLDGDRGATALDYQLPDTDFAVTFTTDETIGEAIELIGHGRSGILGKPPGYVAENTPATGDIVIKLHAADDSAAVINVYESENEL